MIKFDVQHLLLITIFFKSSTKVLPRPTTATTALSRSNTTIKLKKKEENIITENFKEIPALKMPVAIQTE